MKPTLHRVEDVPNGFSYYDSEALSEYDVAYIPSNVADAYYWYAAGSYEGTGNMISVTFDGKWHHNGLGHCSCYGPCSNIETREDQAKDSLEELVTTFSPELVAECRGIILRADPSFKFS